MSWFDTNGGSKDKEDWTQLNPRVVVCAPREDLPFWKARLESLGVNRVDLHHTHRDALNCLYSHDPSDNVAWTEIMLFDNKIEWAPDFSEKDEELLSDECYVCWTCIIEIGEFSSRKVTYKSCDQKLIDLLAGGFNRTNCYCYGLWHVYEPSRHVKKGNL